MKVKTVFAACVATSTFTTYQVPGPALIAGARTTKVAFDFVVAADPHDPRRLPSMDPPLLKKTSQDHS